MRTATKTSAKTEGNSINERGKDGTDTRVVLSPNNSYSSVLSKNKTEVGPKQMGEQQNPFYYGKEQILALWKVVRASSMPLEMEAHENVTSKACLEPVLLHPATDMEEKVLDSNGQLILDPFIFCKF